MMGIAVSWLQFLFPDMGYSKPARAGWARIHLGSSLPRHVNSERHQNPSNSDTDFDDGSVAADDLLTFDSISSSGEGNLFEECSDTWNDARGNDTKPPTSARGLVDDAIVDDDDDDVNSDEKYVHHHHDNATNRDADTLGGATSRDASHSPVGEFDAIDDADSFDSYGAADSVNSKVSVVEEASGTPRGHARARGEADSEEGEHDIESFGDSDSFSHLSDVDFGDLGDDLSSE